LLKKSEVGNIHQYTWYRRVGVKIIQIGYQKTSQPERVVLLSYPALTKLCIIGGSSYSEYFNARFNLASLKSDPSSKNTIWP
jgi:hypothetical protein